MAEEPKLYQFLRELAENPDMLAKFETDAYKTMTDYGLNAEEKDLVLSGDEERIMQAFGAIPGPGPAPVRYIRVVRIRNIRIRFGV